MLVAYKDARIHSFLQSLRSLIAVRTKTSYMDLQEKRIRVHVAMVNTPSSSLGIADVAAAAAAGWEVGGACGEVPMAGKVMFS